MTTFNPYALMVDLKRTAETHDRHVQAAVALLVEHEYWVHNARFVSAAVRTTEAGSYIVWSQARTAFDDGAFDASSTSQLAVLDLAIAIGGNRFKLNLMGDYNAGIMAAAFAKAARVETAAGDSR